MARLARHWRASSRSICRSIAAISEEKGAYRYAPGKWSLKQVLGHVIDTERILGFRGTGGKPRREESDPRLRAG